MKVLLRMLALAGIGPAVAAAQSVTLYGVVDTGVEYVSDVGSTRSGLVRMANNGGMVPSRWGLRGAEDLGNGLKAIFWLESGFQPDSGVSGQGGRLFGRQALVGLSSPYGQIAFGRQYTMLFWAMLEPDILGPGVFGSGSLDVYTTTPRADNAISYKGKFGGFTLGATYSLGRDTVNAGPSAAGTNCEGENPADSKACREWSALLQYDAARWGIAVAYDSLRGGAGAFGGLTSSGLKDDRLVVNGYVMIDKAKVGAGWIRRDNRGSTTTRRSDLYYLGASYPITPALGVDAEAFHLRYHDSANKAWLFAGRVTYALSKRTTVYGTAGRIDNRGGLAMSVSTNAAPPAGGNQIGVMAGVKHIF